MAFTAIPIALGAVPEDFNGDGHPDLVWMNMTTRQVTVRYFAGVGGAVFQGSNYLDASGEPGWHVAAIADFNGDGVPDVVWQNDARQVTVWYFGGAGGATLQSWNYLDAGGHPGWHVVAAADFNRDGVPDLVWQNDITRQVLVWYMGGAGGATLESYTYLDAVGHPGWTVVAAADFNGDGVPDLVWQNDIDRQATVWYMGGVGGATLQSWNYLDAAGHPGWTLVRANDFDRNGVPDLIWQNDITSQILVWYMGGTGGATMLSNTWLDQTGEPGWQVGPSLGPATILNPTATSILPAGSTLHVSWYGGCQASSYLLTVDRQTAGTIQQYLLSPGIQSWSVNLGGDLPQASIQTVRLLTICGGVQQQLSSPMSTPLGTCESLVPCSKYKVNGSGSPDSAGCSPSDCHPPVWTPVNFPIWYCYNVTGPNDSVGGQPDNCLNQPAQPQNGIYTLNLPTCGEANQPLFNGIPNDYNDCTKNYNGFIDGSFPDVGLPDVPYFWAGCDQNGNCTQKLGNTVRYRASPEVRNAYVVNKTDSSSLWFRGFEFRGIFKAPSPPQALADTAVFFSNGINFSGGVEYGFRLTYNKQYPVEFYYAINSNCTCGLGYPCSSTVQCKSSDSPSGPLVAPNGQELPISTVQLGSDYYFGAWIYWDTVRNKYMFKVDVLDATTFVSLCTPGTVCHDPIEPVFPIPRDYSWGQIYAKAGPIPPTFPNPDTTDVPFATPTSPTGVVVKQITVGK